MTLLPFEEALARTLEGANRLGEEECPLFDADGRVLATDLVAERSLPEHDHSAMDGYAVRVADLEGDGPYALDVVGESRAGSSESQLAQGKACRIFTGAPIPAGADAVVMQEHVSRDGDRLTLTARPRPGLNIRPRGEDLALGSLALTAGVRLDPAKLGLAAALDRDRVHVARRPRLTLLATGDELRAPASPYRPGSIPESNRFVLAAIARRAGADVRCLPFVGDDRAALERALLEGLDSTDLLVSIGGASVGDHDHVRPTLLGLGATFAFWGVSMRPGKPTAFGHLRSVRVLCLPGNPASATLAFHLFGVPLLRALQGERSPAPSPILLPVIGAHRRNLGANCDGRDDFLRADIETVHGVLHARLAARQSSGAVTSFAEARALVRLSGHRERIEDGEPMPVLMLRDLCG